MHIDNYSQFLLLIHYFKIFCFSLQQFLCNVLKLIIYQLIFSVLNKKASSFDCKEFHTYHSIMLIKFYSLAI